MPAPPSRGRSAPSTRGVPSLRHTQAGPSQRQLRAGELVRHALADILREEEVADPALAGVSVTVTEVRMSPDLLHAHCYVEPLGAGVAGVGLDVRGVIDALNRAAKFYRGRLGRRIELKFTPDLKFVHDQSFDEASRIDRLFDQPAVRRDLDLLSSPAERSAAGEGDHAQRGGGGSGAPERQAGAPLPPAGYSPRFAWGEE